MNLQAIDIPEIGIEVTKKDGVWLFRPKGWTLFWTKVPDKLLDYVERHVPSANT